MKSRRGGALRTAPSGWRLSTVGRPFRREISEDEGGETHGGGRPGLQGGLWRPSKGIKNAEDAETQRGRSRHEIYGADGDFSGSAAKGPERRGAGLLCGTIFWRIAEMKYGIGKNTTGQF
jgi:hypothetical protein